MPLKISNLQIQKSLVSTGLTTVSYQISWTTYWPIWGLSICKTNNEKTPRLNLKLGVTGRISVQPETSSAAKMSVEFELQGVELGFYIMTYIALEVDAARWTQNMGDAAALKRKQQDSVSTNLPQLWERKTIKRLLSVCSGQLQQH